MASREHPQSLVELPIELRAMIAGRVGATSKQPVEDLQSLRPTCKSMLGPCCDSDVSRHLALGQLPIEQLQNTDLDGYDVFVRSLAAVGNPVAGFLTGMDDIFGKNRGWCPPLDELHHAAHAGNRGASYVSVVLLYRFYSGADTDATTFAYMRHVEGEAQGPQMIINLQSEYFRTRTINLAKQMRTIALRQTRCRPMLPPAVARGNIQHCVGRTFCGKEPNRRGFAFYFCSVECRLCFECDTFFFSVNHVYIG
jgi:hypothetical protein